MTLEQVEERASEIDAYFNAEDTSELNLEELRCEAEALKARKEELLEERKQTINEIVEEKKTEIIEKGEDKKMEERTLQSVLSSEEYINAYARYIKTNDKTEVRKLLTELAPASSVGQNDSDTVPVPSYLEPRINTAWENEGIVSRAAKSYIKGIIKQGIEISATDAVVHAEGADAPTEEKIVIGVIQIVPETLKKWISISDEVLDMQGRAFLDYIFDEIEYKLVQLASQKVVNAIATLPQTYPQTNDSAIAQAMTGAVAANTIIMAEALLSDEARNPIVIANKQTIAAFKALMTADGYLVQNPFDGLPVVPSSALPAYSTASSGDVFAIVGDMSAVRMNFPNGQGVEFKYDDLSLAEKDLVKIVGRMPVGIAVTASDRFVLIKKA